MLTSFLTKVRTLLSESLNAYVTLYNETSSFTLGHLHIVPTGIAFLKNPFLLLRASESSELCRSSLLFKGQLWLCSNWFI